MMADSYRQIYDIASKFNGDNIYIVGKGKSADEINFAGLEPGIIININDSERIVRGDICVFRSDWVIESLSQYGFGCSLYVTDKQLPGEVPNLVINRASLDRDGYDYIFHRFGSPEIVMEEVLFVTALKIAKVIANVKMRRLNVFFVGFDFDAGVGYSASIEKDYSGDDSGYKSSYLYAQEHLFLLFMNHLRESNVLIRHVGNHMFSQFTCADFNKMYANLQVPEPTDSRAAKGRVEVVAKGKEQQIEGREKDQKADSVEIVAEFTTNHFGDLDRLAEMIKRAAESGADIVKVQKRHVDTFYSAEQLNSKYISVYGERFVDYRKGLELDEDGFELIVAECKKHNIKWSVSILDYKSYEFVMRFDPPVIKLPSTISQHREFIDKVASEYTGDIVVSTGFTDSDYERYVLGLFSNNNQVYLLQCISAYPTRLADCSIGVVRHYYNLSKKFPNVVPGYSSHDIGSLASSMAVAAGARMIEKHVKYGTVEGAHFDEVAVSLKSDDFKKFVEDIRLAQKICGTEEKKIKECEHHKYWL